VTGAYFPINAPTSAGSPGTTILSMRAIGIAQHAPTKK
jgi:hypothetical protein